MLDLPKLFVYDNCFELEKQMRQVSALYSWLFIFTRILRSSECQFQPLGAILFSSPSVVRSHFLVYTLASTNISQWAPNLVQLYMTIRSRISWIMELIRLQLSRVVCPWIRKFAIFDFVYTLASANIDQSVPNLATIYTPMRSRMSLIMGRIELERPELFALEFGKIYMTLLTPNHLLILSNQHQTWSKCMWS